AWINPPTENDGDQQIHSKTSDQTRLKNLDTFRFRSNRHQRLRNHPQVLRCPGLDHVPENIRHE
ncbi:hypothetical protein ACIBEF_31995, partial [Micromonospora sp. NPDC050795]|uniref:hypothetical protein n=1 Tax=Micromonospora sp. NPDC050795 TaxID=3364282 RepID=UPI0037966076